MVYLGGRFVTVKSGSGVPLEAASLCTSMSGVRTYISGAGLCQVRGV